MEDSQKLWSSVGSAGTVDLADLDKVVFANSIVELIGIVPVFEPARLTALGAPVLAYIHAVVRYGVTPVDGVSNPQGFNYGLRLRYRDGAGQVAARFIQVEIATGAETPLVNFDRHSGNRAFQVQQEIGGFSGELDFVNNAYYVELTLAAAASPLRPLTFPPAVSVVQLILANF